MQFLGKLCIILWYTLSYNNLSILDWGLLLITLTVQSYIAYILPCSSCYSARHVKLTDIILCVSIILKVNMFW